MMREMFGVEVEEMKRAIRMVERGEESIGAVVKDDRRQARNFNFRGRDLRLT